MPTIGYAQLPVPAGGDGPQVVSAVADLATALDPHLVQHAEDQADRDARFSTAPVHTLVIAEDGTAWMKLDSGTNTWTTIHSPLQAWQSTLTLKSGFEESTVPLGVRVKDDTHVYLKGRIERTDGNKILDANAVNLGAVPSGLIPPTELRTWAGTCSMAGTTTLAAGRLEVLNTGTASAYGVAGDILWWYQGPDGTDWVDISGDYWMD
ncbi:hypothetical protein F3K32_18220 [Streptomyces sp. LBUM 1483]|uniref:hypothetical protein n=1 Tax=Streptomyces scabiei TaxID=1930 RepID=UPI001FF29683|nr:hypothetical protein [Streptomyces sp. LBUM 1483]MBP5922190.1 hypothetical protein [Streptomyces sp. LBUM 1483]